MKENTFENPLKTEGCSLDEIARLGAQEMLKIYLESEIQSFIEFHKGKKLENGQSAIIRKRKKACVVFEA